MLEVRRCGLCGGWVAGYGAWECEDACPLLAAWRALAASVGATP